MVAPCINAQLRAACPTARVPQQLCASCQHDAAHTGTGNRAVPHSRASAWWWLQACKLPNELPNALNPKCLHVLTNRLLGHTCDASPAYLAGTLTGDLWGKAGTGVRWRGAGSRMEGVARGRMLCEFCGCCHVQRCTWEGAGTGRVGGSRRRQGSLGSSCARRIKLAVSHFNRRFGQNAGIKPARALLLLYKGSREHLWASTLTHRHAV